MNQPLSERKLPAVRDCVGRGRLFLAERFPDASVAIALEQSRGALVAGLLNYPHVRLYPINPAQLDSYRKAMGSANAKRDPNDARLLAQFLQH